MQAGHQQAYSGDRVMIAIIASGVVALILALSVSLAITGGVGIGTVSAQPIMANTSAEPQRDVAESQDWAFVPPSSLQAVRVADPGVFSLSGVSIAWTTFEEIQFLEDNVFTFTGEPVNVASYDEIRFLEDNVFTLSGEPVEHLSFEQMKFVEQNTQLADLTERLLPHTLDHGQANY